MCSVWCLNGVSGVSHGGGGSGQGVAAIILPPPPDGVGDIRLSLIINCPASTPELPLAWLGPQLNYRLNYLNLFHYVCHTFRSFSLSYQLPTKLPKPISLCKTHFALLKNHHSLTHSLTHSIVERSTRLHARQYKINHRFLACNKWLADKRVRESSKCNYSDEMDTVQHALNYCPNVFEFLKRLVT